MRSKPVEQDLRAWRERQRAELRPEQAFVQKMTNWQRSQWARGGYPKNRAQAFLKRRRGVCPGDGCDGCLRCSP